MKSSSRAAFLLVQPCAFHRAGDLAGEALRDEHVAVVELPFGDVALNGDRADDFSADEQRHAHQALRAALAEGAVHARGADVDLSVGMTTDRFVRRMAAAASTVTGTVRPTALGSPSMGV